jgi:hypothetical protein
LQEPLEVEGVFDTTYSADKPSHVWLELEPEVFGDFVVHPAQCRLSLHVYGIVAEDRPYVVVAGTAEDVHVLVTNRDYKRLAASLLLVNRYPDEENPTPVKAARLKRRARIALAKLICEGRYGSI